MVYKAFLRSLSSVKHNDQTKLFGRLLFHDAGAEDTVQATDNMSGDFDCELSASVIRMTRRDAP